MRKFMIVVAVFLLVAPVFAFEAGDQVAVSVRVGELKSGPGFLGRTVAQLEYGESVEVLEARGDWVMVRVSATGTEGWVHSTTVAGKRALRLDMSNNSSAGSTSTREIALAGRGFNEQVETRYKSEKGLDFSFVDEMEEYGQPVQELAVFLEEGGLTVGGGGVE